MSTRRIQSIFILLVYNPKQCCKIAMKLDEKMSEAKQSMKAIGFIQKSAITKGQKRFVREKSPLNTFQAQKKRVEPNLLVCSSS